MAVTVNTAILWDVKPHCWQKGTNISDEHLAFTFYPVERAAHFSKTEVQNALHYIPNDHL